MNVMELLLRTNVKFEMVMAYNKNVVVELPVNLELLKEHATVMVMY